MAVLELQMDVRAVRVWNVKDQDGQPIRVATIEQAPRTPGMCEGCPSPCCKGIFQPVLTQEEWIGRKFMSTMIPPPAWLRERVPRAQYLAVLLTTPMMGCPYHDHLTNTCTKWPSPPAACLSYDCRTDRRPEIAAFASQREASWRER